MEIEARRVREGLDDPKAAHFTEADRLPLTHHLDDFHGNLIAKGSTPKHADLTLDRTRRIAGLVVGAKLAEIETPRKATKAQREQAAGRLTRLLEGATLGDLSPSRVQEALSTLRTAGRSLATCNHHRTAIRGFARWAWKDGRMRDNPLHDVTGYNAKEDRRHDRRTLGFGELRKRIDSAQSGPAYRKMSGPDRALCYRLAVATGLHYSEIKSIRPESFALSGNQPTVTVEAAYTKNGDPASFDLTDDLVAGLIPWLASRPKDVPVFPLPNKGADMIRFDLDAAGIPYRDDDGLVFDFHSLRCQLATIADQSGISPRVIQKLMRHSTLELTGRYTRPRAADLKQAVSFLPSLGPGLTQAVRRTDAGSTHVLPSDRAANGRRIVSARGEG